MSDIDLTLHQFQREDEEKHAKQMADKLSLSYINLVGYPVAPEVLTIIPEDQARKYNVVSYLRAQESVKVATFHPKNPELTKFLADLAIASKNKFMLSFCSKSSVLYGLSLYRVLAPEAPKEEKVEVTEEREASFDEEIKTFEGLKEKTNIFCVFKFLFSNDSNAVHFI